MSRIRPALAAAVCLLVSATLFAQGKPGSGSPLAAAQVVVDSNGNRVGDAIDVVNGLRSAYVKYVLPNGDSVVLVANSSALNATLVPPVAYDINFARVFFTSNNCTGDAYILDNNPTVQSTFQLTRYQGATIAGVLPSQLPPPVPDPNCPLMPISGDEWLYTSLSGSCPRVVDPSNPITFKSFYGMPYGPSGATPAPGAGPFCSVPPGGEIAIPTMAVPYGAFYIYTPTENLSLKYKAPFYVK